MENQIQRLRDQSTRVSAVLVRNKVKSSPKPDPMGDVLSDLADLKTEYAKKVSMLIKRKKQIQKVIDSLQRADYRIILTEYYINMKTWEQVAIDNYYSYYHVVHRLHPGALRQIEKML